MLLLPEAWLYKEFLKSVCVNTVCVYLCSSTGCPIIECRMSARVFTLLCFAQQVSSEQGDRQCNRRQTRSHIMF